MKLKRLLKLRPGSSTALGVLFAILAGLLLLGYLSNQITGKRGGPDVEVPVSGRNIELGTVIRNDFITSKKIPKDYLVPGTVTETGDIDGRRALRFIGKGEPFTSSSISDSRGSGTLASRIPADLRAYSLKPGANSGAGPELRPGDSVDVLTTAGNPPKTTTLLTNRLVLNAGGLQGTSPEKESMPDEPAQITILVSPQEAELLAQAGCEGQISIVLCPLADQKN